MEVANISRDGNNSTELQHSQSIKTAGKLNSYATYVNGEETTGMEHVSQQKWNHPRINMWRTFATFLGFFIMGLNDGAYGVWPGSHSQWLIADLCLGLDTLRWSLLL